jgi:hypothetical protein
MSVLDESTLTIAEAARIGRTSFCSVWRWLLRGVPDPQGRRVRLEGVRVGGRWLTSKEALERFAEALTPQWEDDARTPPRTKTARRKASQRAAIKLQEVGI